MLNAHPMLPSLPSRLLLRTPGLRGDTEGAKVITVTRCSQTSAFVVRQNAALVSEIDTDAGIAGLKKQSKY